MLISTYLSLLFSKKAKYNSKKILLCLFLVDTLNGIEYAWTTQAIINLFATFVIHDDSGIFQDGQMLTDRCKLHTDSVDKFATHRSPSEMGNVSW